MATAFIDSTANKAKAEHLLQRIAAGTLPEPPIGTQKRNVCEMCQATTVLRYYIQSHGWCCGECLDASRAAPVWCNTRADQVHRGRFHIIPQCVIDAEAASNAPVAAQDAPQRVTVANPGPSWVDAQVAKIKAQRGDESLACEARWHAARRLGEARRGAVVARMP